MRTSAEAQSAATAGMRSAITPRARTTAVTKTRSGSRVYASSSPRSPLMFDSSARCVSTSSFSARTNAASELLIRKRLMCPRKTPGRCEANVAMFASATYCDSRDECMAAISGRMASRVSRAGAVLTKSAASATATPVLVLCTRAAAQRSSSRWSGSIVWRVFWPFCEDTICSSSWPSRPAPCCCTTAASPADARGESASSDRCLSAPSSSEDSPSSE
mmetsp:Transcript_4731/g.18895  ORF Transcript_4731/g.18895 Transcript_4731/m.18895 type:complete len:218 (-) Transcript_4731:1233-1886(-)